MIRNPQELERWIAEHPRLAWLYTIGACVLIFEVAAILDQLARLAGRHP